METVVVPVGQSLQAKNAALAQENRARFQSRQLLVLNVLSSPGAGKTALLERTLTDMGSRVRAAVIVGDLATDHDAQRLRRSGAQAVQITTGTVCHLDAAMVARACEHIDLDALDLLFIENVGNLVCPAAYDLGEELRVVLFSVTEGEDKPLKYPTIFKGAHVVIVSKSDLAGPAEFQRDLALENVRRMAPQVVVFELSARTGQGLPQWYDFLLQRQQRLQKGIS
jgi:hydrogenase nickel incorporation protein HypB